MRALMRIGMVSKYPANKPVCLLCTPQNDNEEISLQKMGFFIYAQTR